MGLIIRDPRVIPMVSLERDVIAEICSKLPYFQASSSGLVGGVFESLNPEELARIAEKIAG